MAHNGYSDYSVVVNLDFWNYFDHSLNVAEAPGLHLGLSAGGGDKGSRQIYTAIYNITIYDPMLRLRQENL